MIEAGWWAPGGPDSSIRLHWSLPVVLGAVWLGGSWVLAAGALVVLLVHGLGHVLLLRRVGGALGALELHGLGGDATPAGKLSAKHRSVVAWGGALAQLALYAAALLALRAEAPLPEDLQLALTRGNLTLLLLNLIPLHPFDGAEAWLLPRRLQERYEGYGQRQIAIAKALIEEERRRHEDPVMREVRAALRGEPPPAAAEAEAQGEGLIQAQDLPVDPSFELPDDDIPEGLVREVGGWIQDLIQGEPED